GHFGLMLDDCMGELGLQLSAQRVAQPGDTHRATGLVVAPAGSAVTRTGGGHPGEGGAATEPQHATAAHRRGEPPSLWSVHLDSFVIGWVLTGRADHAGHASSRPVAS